jgi:hypothetical protein
MSPTCTLFLFLNHSSQQIVLLNIALDLFFQLKDLFLSEIVLRTDLFPEWIYFI